MYIRWSLTTVQSVAQQLIRALETTAGVLVVDDDGQEHTGIELLARSEQWGDTFLGAGFEPGNVVGIALARSVDQIASMVAVLALGGSYVPLDPAYPFDRLRFMAEDSGIKLLATTGEISIAPAKSVLAPAKNHPVRDSAVRSPQPNPRGLAYTIYTSGSSGRPKGVLISNDNLAAFMTEWDSICTPATDDRWLAMTSLSFDPSVVELLWTVRCGCVVVLAGDSIGPGDIGRAIAAHGVTHLQCTPTRAAMLLAEEADARELGKLRRVFVGGEVLPAELARQLRSVVPMVTNLYGPTETTVWAFAYDVAANGDIDSVVDPVPIGTPLRGVTAAVSADVANGVGELVLSGPDVAVGYTDREQTVMSFGGSAIADPDANASDGGARNSSSAALRSYRTGDLVRRNTDGNFVFAGRSDGQLKILGTRIEPAEIESVLLADSRVAQAAAVVRSGGSGIARLVAFVTLAPSAPERLSDADHAPSSEQALLAGLLRDCRQRLPAAYVPHRIEVVCEMPLTPSGKIDRKRLPEVSVEPIVNESYSGPSNRPLTTQEMCSLWSGILGRPIVATDDYFQCGGDSLAAVALIEVLRARTGQPLGISALVEAPTPEQLVERVRERRDSSALLVPIRAVPAPRKTLFLIHGARGNVLHFTHSARLLPPHLSVLAFQAQELARPSGSEDQSIESMAEGFVAELRLAHPVGPYVLGGYSDGGFIAWEMARQLLRDGESIDRILLLDTGVRVTPTSVPVSRRIGNVVRNLHGRRSNVSEFIRDAVRAQREERERKRAKGLMVKGPGTEGVPELFLDDQIELAALRYRVQPLDVDVELIRSRHTPVAVHTDFNWPEFARSCNTTFADGSHLDMVGPAHAQSLADALVEALRR